jgi:hypothetical protein
MENDFRLKIMQIGFASNQNLKQPLKNERRNEKKAQCRNTNTKGKKTNNIRKFSTEIYHETGVS